MSGFVANKGLITPVYNSSKAAVIQLGRKSRDGVGKEGFKGQTAFCPGHILTPMVQKNFEDDPSLKGIWEKENTLGRLSTPEEYRGAALFLLSDASSFMTGTCFSYLSLCVPRFLTDDGAFSSINRVSNEREAFISIVPRL